MTKIESKGGNNRNAKSKCCLIVVINKFFFSEFLFSIPNKFTFFFFLIEIHEKKKMELIQKENSNCFDDHLLPLQQFFLKNNIRMITKHLISLKEDLNVQAFMQSVKKIMERHLSLREIYFKTKEGKYKVVVADIEQIVSQSITFTLLDELANQNDQIIKSRLMGIGDELIKQYLNDFEGKISSQFKIYKIGRKLYILAILNHLVYGKMKFFFHKIFFFFIIFFFF